MDKGLKEGMDKGLKEGMKQKQIEIAQKLLKQKMEIEQIMSITGLSKQEILKLNK